MTKMEPHDPQSRLQHAIEDRLTFGLGKIRSEANLHDWYFATALATRDLIVRRWLDIRPKIRGKKRVYYLSIEFLFGRLLQGALANLGLAEETRSALKALGVDLDDVCAAEPDAALGNGGLGRLAACYLDSMAALGIPSYGYGLRYEHGLFAQKIKDGWQEETPELWLKTGSPWELTRPEKEYIIGFGGVVEYVGGDHETAPAVWYPAESVIATTHDIPIVGWRAKHVSMLRIWGARATDPVQLTAFNQGDYMGAMAARIRADAITRVLYPGDSTDQGRELRLRQEYFFTAASLQDIVRRHLAQVGDIKSLASHAAIQMNDTHPALAVAELMRVLVDEHNVSWPDAWEITRSTIGFTNHTLMPEALEKWPVDLFGRLLPRHLQIIYLINHHHLKDATQRSFVDSNFIKNISLIDETGERSVRMAHLAFIGSHHVNGVSELHTELLKKTVFRELSQVAPSVIVNKTNGISFRRWLLQSNTGLTRLIADAIGTGFFDEPDQLIQLEHLAGDRGFIEGFEKARAANKFRLAKFIRQSCSISIDPDALFDVHIKRIHEYKRQSLNILETIALYLAIKANPAKDFPARVKIFAGKAAPGYWRAKLLIKLAHDVANVVNHDPLLGDRLKVVFIPNYGVSIAELAIPAADLSEQISTAGMEASGTGNMKFAVNGALTLGTCDGANIEINRAVGSDNIFMFGMSAEDVEQHRREGYQGIEAARSCPELEGALSALAEGAFSADEKDRYRDLVGAFLAFDPFMVAADFAEYWKAQRKVDDRWRDRSSWWQSSILNTARMGWFSSDRAVKEYATEIWRVLPHD